MLHSTFLPTPRFVQPEHVLWVKPTPTPPQSSAHVQWVPGRFRVNRSKRRRLSLMHLRRGTSHHSFKPRKSGSAAGEAHSPARRRPCGKNKNDPNSSGSYRGFDFPPVHGSPQTSRRTIEAERLLVELVGLVNQQLNGKGRSRGGARETGTGPEERSTQRLSILQNSDVRLAIIVSTESQAGFVCHLSSWGLEGM